MKKRDKKGQFYLLAAIVIISIIIGFSAISTYVNKGTTTRIYDLGKELEIESASVIDYGTYNPDTRDTGELLEDFSNLYADYLGEDKEIVFVIVTPEEITTIPYQFIDAGEVSTGEGEASYQINRRPRGYIQTHLREGGEEINPEECSEEETCDISDVILREGKSYVNVKFGEKDSEYEFELPQGHNYYFVLEQEVGEEKFVYTKEQ